MKKRGRRGKGHTARSASAFKRLVIVSSTALPNASWLSCSDGSTTCSPSGSSAACPCCSCVLREGVSSCFFAITSRSIAMSSSSSYKKTPF
jgi:hypothetical protein